MQVFGVRAQYAEIENVITYRSLSFHESHPDTELIRVCHSLGYNDLTFQTEKGTLPRLEDLAKRAKAGGWFQLAKQLGMSITVWTHEFNEWDVSREEIRPDNADFWSQMAARHRYVLDDLLPEIDSLCLTVVESQIDAANENLTTLVETLLGLCRDRGKQLMLRTFVHHPEQAEQVRSALAELPDDVIIMTKAVPQD